MVNIMTTYARKEIISSSNTAKKLGQILDDLRKGIKERVIISKNNQLEAVILPIEDYEKIIELAELVDHLQISNIVKKREKETAEISFDEVLKQSGITRDEI